MCLCMFTTSRLFSQEVLLLETVQMHIALVAACDRRLVSSPAVLADGFVELGCSTWCFPLLARTASSLSMCRVHDWSTLGANAPCSRERDQELDSPAFGPLAHRLRCTSNL